METQGCASTEIRLSTISHSLVQVSESYFSWDITRNLPPLSSRRDEDLSPPVIKPQSRAGNQAQVHLIPQSTLLHSNSRKSQAGWVMAWQLSGSALCLCDPYRPAFPGEVLFCQRDLWGAKVSFGGRRILTVQKKSINNCIVLYFTQSS